MKMSPQLSYQHQQQQTPSQQIILFQHQQEYHPSPSAFPWLTPATANIDQPLLKFHNEIVDFYLYIAQPSPSAQLQQSQILCDAIKKEIANMQKDAWVCAPFLTTKMQIKSTQTQLFILLPQPTAQNITPFLTMIRNITKSQPTPLDTNESYPLFEYELTPAHSTPLLLHFLDLNTWHSFFSLIEHTPASIPQFRYIFILLSFMVRQRWMHLNVRSYMLFGLVSLFEEKRKQKQRLLSQTFIKFLEYFGVGVLHERKISYLGDNNYEHTPDHFSFWVGGVNMSNQTLKEFLMVVKNRYRLISNINFQGNGSILGALINPVGKEFQF